MMPVTVLVPTLLCLTLAQVSPEPPPRLRVALLPVLIDAGDEVNASAIFRVVSTQTQRRRTLRLMSIDEFFFHDGGQRADDVLACGSDTRCVARQLAPFSADLGLVVIVNGQLDPPLLGVLTLDTRSGRPIAERYQQVSGRNVLPALEKTLARHLDQAGHPAWARLDVRVEPPRASVRLVPAFPAEAGRPNSFIVPPGAYTVRAEMDDYDAAQTTAALSPGATMDVRLDLQPDAAWYESPWVWVGAAAVVAAAAAVTVTAVSLSSETTCGCVITADHPTCPPCP